MITKVTATVVRKVSGETPFECVVEYIVNTGKISDALKYVEGRLAEGGWKYIKITAKTTYLHEINDNKEI